MCDRVKFREWKVPGGLRVQGGRRWEGLGLRPTGRPIPRAPSRPETAAPDRTSDLRRLRRPPRSGLRGGLAPRPSRPGLVVVGGDLGLRLALRPGLVRVWSMALDTSDARSELDVRRRSLVSSSPLLALSHASPLSSPSPRPPRRGRKGGGRGGRGAGFLPLRAADDVYLSPMRS